jgi:hypothetical protein
VKREKEENERRKDNFEKSIRRVWNGSDVPCLFDPKIAYSQQLYALPVGLEQQIRDNKVPNEDLVFRRYKVLVVPLDGLMQKTSGQALIEITNYFLRYSTLKRVENVEDLKLKTFPFKCIGLVQSVAVPPFNKCSLAAAVISSDSPTPQRVLTLLFDTHDHPKLKHNFNETLKLIKLHEIFSAKSIKELALVYPQFLESLASDYVKASK